MRKLFILLFLFTVQFFHLSVQAQTPNKISYQAVVRDASGLLVLSKMIGIEINIRQGSLVGTIVYTENQTPTTNENGLVNIEIGGGVGFSTINWSSDNFFIETKIALVAPFTTYTISSTSQLLSVPYAFHAKTAESISGTITETDPVFTSWNKSTGIIITKSQISDLGSYLTSFTESDPVYDAKFDLTGSSSGDILKFDGTKYIKFTPNYLTSYTESDPIFVASPANGISTLNIGNWNTAFAWGNHANAGYLTSYTESDPIYAAKFDLTGSSSGDILKFDGTKYIKYTPNYLTSYTESDPIYIAKFDLTGSSSGDILKFDGTKYIKYTPNYLTSYTESDPVFVVSPANGISTLNIANWNTAFAWGNHAEAGYLTSYTESDPVYDAKFDLTGSSSGDILKFDGTKFVKFTPNYLTSYNETDPFWTAASTNYYTKTNLQTSGQASVSWNNIADKPTGNNAGDMLYWNGTSWVNVAVGQSGQYLQLNELKVPVWSGASFPVLTTSAASSVTGTSATTGGNISVDGGLAVSVRGICWNTTGMPTISDNKTTDGIGIGVFVSSMTGLSLNTKYYVRSYATNSLGTGYGNEITFITPLSIGDIYGGGKVAYIYQSGDPGYIAGEVHGLIAADADQSAGITWRKDSYIATGATAQALGTGMANTIQIVNKYGDGVYAAKLCNDLTLNGYTDWWLPSREEMNKIFINRGIIGGFTDYFYWTSSEYNTANAYYKYFPVGSSLDGGTHNPYRVRPVRYF